MKIDRFASLTAVVFMMIFTSSELLGGKSKDKAAIQFTQDSSSCPANRVPYYVVVPTAGVGSPNLWETTICIFPDELGFNNLYDPDSLRQYAAAKLIQQQVREGFIHTGSLTPDQKPTRNAVDSKMLQLAKEAGLAFLDTHIKRARSVGEEGTVRQLEAKKAELIKTSTKTGRTVSPDFFRKPDPEIPGGCTWGVLCDICYTKISQIGKMRFCAGVCINCEL